MGWNVSFDGTRVNTAEATTNWTAAAATPTLEPDFRYQGGNCISAQVKTAETGFYYRQAGVTHDFTTPKIWLAKVIITNKDALDGNGLVLEIGDGARTNYHRYFTWSATSYPILGGWTIVPIDPTAVNYRSATVGTPTLSVVDFFGVQGDCNAISKAANLGMDAVDYIASGTGLTLAGGAGGGDPDGYFGSFVVFDEGTTNNRWGIVTTREGIIYVNGTLTIGNATATGFTDSNQVLVFPDGRYQAGFCGVNFGLQNASTTIFISNCVFNGKGRKAFYDTRPNYTVNGKNGTLSISGSTFNVFRYIQLDTSTTMSNCNFLNGERIIQGGALLSNCTVSGATTPDGYAFVIADNPANIQDCNFTFSDGYGIEINRAGTFTFQGNSFTGYGANGTGDAAVYNNSGGAVTLNITGSGDSPTFTNGTGASTTINNAVVLTISCKNEAGLAIQGIRVRIERDDNGTMIAEGTTNASGIFTTSFNYTGDIDAKVVARLKGYKNNSAVSTITTSGLSVPFTMLRDEAVNLP